MSVRRDNSSTDAFELEGLRRHAYRVQRPQDKCVCGSTKAKKGEQDTALPQIRA